MLLILNSVSAAMNLGVLLLVPFNSLVYINLIALLVNTVVIIMLLLDRNSNCF